MLNTSLQNKFHQLDARLELVSGASALPEATENLSDVVEIWLKF